MASEFQKEKAKKNTLENLQMINNVNQKKFKKYNFDIFNKNRIN